ncbi:MAG TPA: acyl-CoA desaturase, partial [Chloroflexota bacterium]|nr:acyl-CoA desaturase [Chloroflexota bacterium]
MGILAGVATILAALLAIKLLERRLPRGVYQAALVIGLTVPVVCSLYALWTIGRAPITWREVALFAGFYLLTGLGTTLGLHRLLTHRSFETYPAVKLVFLILGAMANQGRPIDWAANHLKHHANADRDGDPHSPLDGFFHAHVAWIVTAPPAERERYCAHLLADRSVVFVDLTAPIWLGLGLLIPFLLDGWNGLLWGGIVRTTIGNHVVFAVNSICHVYGEQPFETGDQSRNNWWMALLALGEGWHNNHHAFPSMAFHGMSARQIDLTGQVIRLLAALGLAWR